MANMFRNFFWVFMEKGLILIIQFLSLVILSRKLTPADYGTFGIMMIFIAVADILVDSGFGGAIVRKEKLTQTDINTLFFTNLGVSIFLYLIILVSSPYLADYYSVPELSNYLRILGLVVIIYSFSIVQNSLLVRNLSFKKSAIIMILSTLLAALVAIKAAYSGLGVWALILQQISLSSFMCLMLWGASKIRISLEISKSSFKYMWNFGSKLLIANILQTVFNNITTNLIPKIASVQVSGLYFQANRLSNIPTGIIQMSIDKASFPIFSKYQDREVLIAQARILNKNIYSFLLPILPLLSLFSVEIIQIVLGEKWLNASPYFSILLWGGIGIMIQVMSRNLFKAKGFTKDILFVEIFKTFLGLLLLLFSLQYGVLFLVYGFTISTILGALIWSYQMKKKMNYSFKEQFSDISRPLITTLVVFSVLRLIICNLPHCWYNLLFFPIGYLLYILLNVCVGNESIKKIIRMFLFNKKND